MIWFHFLVSDVRWRDVIELWNNQEIVPVKLGRGFVAVKFERTRELPAVV